MRLLKQIKRLFIDDGELPIHQRRRVVMAEPIVRPPKPAVKHDKS